jgi:hypothetical protein
MTFPRLVLASFLLIASPVAATLPATAQVSPQEATMATSAIMSAGQRAAIVSRIDRVPSVGAVRLDRAMMRLGEDDEGADYVNFRVTAARHAAGIARLRAALSRNPATAAALARHNIDVARVVGVQVSSTGALRLYLL